MNSLVIYMCESCVTVTVFDAGQHRILPTTRFIADNKIHCRQQTKIKENKRNNLFFNYYLFIFFSTIITLLIWPRYYWPIWPASRPNRPIFYRPKFLIFVYNINRKITNQCYFCWILQTSKLSKFD